MGSIPYCDHHGWNWESGQGPSPCMGETASFLLASSVLLYTIPLTKDTLHPFQRAAAAGSTAARVHAVQITLAIVQASIALVCGVLFVRPRGMLSGANLLYSMSWTAASCTMAVALQRHPDCSKTLIWFWCGALVVNSVVLSSLRHASEVSGHHLPAEIGCLSWMSFFANAVLVVLQLFKPELDDTEGVYVRVVGREGVVPSASSANNGWQTFWAGGGDTFDVAATAVSGDDRNTKSGSSSSRWCCFGGRRRGGDDDFEGGGAWPIAGGTNGRGGTLNESLLGIIGLDDQDREFSSPSKPEAGWNNGGGGSSQRRARAGGCFRRVGGFFSSVVDRGNKAASAAAEQEEGRAGGGAGASWLQRQDSPFRRKLWGDGGFASATTVTRASAQSALSAGSSSSSPPSYSGAASIGVRAPPRVAAPIFGVAVTRWRLVDLDGEPLAHGSSSGDVAWTDRSRSASSSSARTATTLSASEATLTGVGGGGGGRASSMVESRFNDHLDPSLALDPNDGARVGEPLGVQFELVVRASGRGEMDWWGRGDSAEPSSPGAGHIGIHPPHGPAPATPGTGAGDWRVWRSAADTLALYDALALRFGQEFCGRVSRPKLKTTLPSSAAGASGVLSDDRSGSPPRPSSPDSPPALIVASAAPHRVDMLRDAKTVGAFLRSLLGLRQFLSTAVMDYLAQPAPASLPADDLSANGGGGAEAGSDHGSDGYFTSDDLLVNDDDERGSRHTTASTSSHHRRPFSSGKADGGSGPSAAGQAVAGAALASDYGTWLKRLAVRLRRATPAGEQFVRLRCISPAVTGEQVVRWLMREKVCNGDRASAVRLGQDMVSHRLLAPVCAGYHRPEEEVTGGGGDSSSGKEPGELLRSFDDAVGWLFAFVGDALRDPFAPPPPTQVAVMSNTGVDVRVTSWTETSDDDGAHVSFVVHTRVEATQEAWESPRRYREFTQLRKRLLRLGIDIPAAAAAAVARNGDDGGGGGGGLAPGLPRKTWRANKFDKEHLEKRRAALEAYLRAAVKEALSAPHLSGHLMMRFLDPDESNLRVLSEQRRQQQRSRNPFARAHNSPPCSPRGGTPGGRRGVGGGAAAAAATADVGNESVGESLTEERTEAEDFDFLTDSLGGFG
ncbi:hypothetical protein Esi_0038_0149 [Ectocarpus siliculosus]|uniref:PX domain-containing protein n=1 Tax=Ectocarpus siliculosus TaxID=2880 RepID=D8LM26_ECTSI|nr:hypothetical protein Esi_0038_0149 [Ectocarpus siliculosus]|eukprot:CBN77240.1 hypothetical protein Esi_0038_0149 [Ectocarpus siliculosus]